MSAATLHRFVVTGFDYDAWRVVVEAASGAEAVAKAEAIYLTDGFGYLDAFEPASSFIDWKVEPLTGEAQL